MDVLDNLLLGFSVAFRPDVLAYGFLGCIVGTLVGMLPGIGPLAGISILLPVTFGLGRDDKVRRATVHWPNGTTQDVTIPGVDQLVEVVEP